MSMYLVPSPARLKEMVGLVKDGATKSLNSVASVWNADRAKHGGNSKIDGNIVVCFSRDGRKRICEIQRMNAMNADRQHVAWCKYTPTLQFCMEKCVLMMTVDNRIFEG